MDDHADKKLIAATDTRILVIVSVIITSLLVLLGCLIFICNAPRLSRAALQMTSETKIDERIVCLCSDFCNCQQE